MLECTNKCDKNIYDKRPQRKKLSLTLGLDSIPWPLNIKPAKVTYKGE